MISTVATSSFKQVCSLKSIFEYFSFNGFSFSLGHVPWKVKVGGLKYAWKIEDVLQKSKNIDGPLEYEVTRSENCGFQEDRKRLATVLYCFLKKEIKKQVGEFTPDWKDEFVYNYRQLQTKHLIKVMLSSPEISCDVLLEHPLFMSVETIVAYKDRICTRMMDDQEMRDYVNAFSESVFASDWTTSIPEPLKKHIYDVVKSPTFYSKLSYMLTVERNLRQHLRACIQAIKDLLSPMHGTTTEFWEGMCPAFFLTLFIVVAVYESDGIMLCNSKAFQDSSFFKAPRYFYAACASQSVYESQIKQHSPYTAGLYNKPHRLPY